MASPLLNTIRGGDAAKFIDYKLENRKIVANLDVYMHPRLY